MKKSLRIYTYKITFEEVPYWYWGVHKEKKYNDGYMGSPKTHKWVWEFYTPKIQILEVFPFTEEGWKEANLVEDRLILPDLNNPLCLNERCNIFCSTEAARKGGKKVGKKIHEEKTEEGKSLHNEKLHAEKDENGKSILAMKMNEKLHADRDENGKSKHSVKLAEKLHKEKDEKGRSVNSMKCHREKNSEGKSVHAVKAGEKVMAALLKEDPELPSRAGKKKRMRKRMTKEKVYLQ